MNDLVNDSQRRRIVGDALAVGVATGAYGISFGAISVASGLDVWQTCALSLLVFTGASQFALVGVIASGGTAAAAAGTAMLLGVRNGLYGLRLARLLDWRGARRVAGAHLLIDESTAMAVDRAQPPRPGSASWPPGCRSSCCGTSPRCWAPLAGERIGDPRTYGLDAAVGGAFLALLWPACGASPARRRGGRGRRPRAWCRW